MSSSNESGFDSLLRNTGGVRLPSNYPSSEVTVSQLESELEKLDQARSATDLTRSGVVR